jgi:hypothetical protein
VFNVAFPPEPGSVCVIVSNSWIRDSRTTCR